MLNNPESQPWPIDNLQILANNLIELIVCKEYEIILIETVNRAFEKYLKTIQDQLTSAVNLAQEQYSKALSSWIYNRRNKDFETLTNTVKDFFEQKIFLPNNIEQKNLSTGVLDFFEIGGWKSNSANTILITELKKITKNDQIMNEVDEKDAKKQLDFLFTYDNKIKNFEELKSSLTSLSKRDDSFDERQNKLNVFSNFLQVADLNFFSANTLLLNELIAHLSDYNIEHPLTNIESQRESKLFQDQIKQYVASEELKIKRENERKIILHNRAGFKFIPVETEVKKSYKPVNISKLDFKKNEGLKRVAAALSNIFFKPNPDQKKPGKLNFNENENLKRIKSALNNIFFKAGASEKPKITRTNFENNEKYKNICQTLNELMSRRPNAKVLDQKHMIIESYELSVDEIESRKKNFMMNREKIKFLLFSVTSEANQTEFEVVDTNARLLIKNM